MPIYWKFILLVLGSYLFGNISNARIISKLKKDDITQHGSGNPGTMNMLRTFGFKLGLLTLLIDAAKGAIPSIIGCFLFGGDGLVMSYIGLYTGGLSVVIGHNFPIFYKFKGGKGVACILGVFAVAEPLLSLVAFVACFIYLYFFDYGAVASFLFITSLTVYEALRFKENITISLFLFVLFFLTFFMHRTNIYRMLTGKEGKVNLKKSLQKVFSKKIRTERKEIKIEKKKQYIDDKKRGIG